MPNSEQVDISIRVRPTVDLVSCIDMVVSLRIDVEPFNLCFGTYQQRSAVGFLKKHQRVWWFHSIRSPVYTAFHSTGSIALIILIMLMYLSEGKWHHTADKHGSIRRVRLLNLCFILSSWRTNATWDTMLLSGESPRNLLYDYKPGRYTLSLSWHALLILLELSSSGFWEIKMSNVSPSHKPIHTTVVRNFFVSQL